MPTHTHCRYLPLRTCRPLPCHPRLQTDVLKHYDSWDSRHFAVFYAGHYFTVPITHLVGHNQVALTRPELQVLFESIMNEVDAEAAKSGGGRGAGTADLSHAQRLSALTTTERTCRNGGPPPPRARRDRHAPTPDPHACGCNRDRDCDRDRRPAQQPTTTTGTKWATVREDCFSFGLNKVRAGAEQTAGNQDKR